MRLPPCLSPLSPPPLPRTPSHPELAALCDTVRQLRSEQRAACRRLLSSPLLHPSISQSVAASPPLLLLWSGRNSDTSPICQLCCFELPSPARLQRGPTWRRGDWLQDVGAVRRSFQLRCPTTPPQQAFPKDKDSCSESSSAWRRLIRPPLALLRCCLRRHSTGFQQRFLLFTP